MKNQLVVLSSLIFCFLFISCHTKTNGTKNKSTETKPNKIVVYQVFTRLFGNKDTTCKPWGTKEENGVGKFADITDTALKEIKNLGITHIWYTGVLHHALVGDYKKYGISDDDPDVVKGRAGSPYAIKDYYNVNPDLAINPRERMKEFEELIRRTHQQGLKVIIDIVPNHIARHYEGKSNPAGVTDFGANDDKKVEYKRDNNFYYIPNSIFEVPVDKTYKPLGGEKHPLSDGKFEEIPAKWTGNGSRNPKPEIWDWYETVKINYGIKPDGSKDFPLLPEGFDTLGFQAHYNFWQDKNVPDTWKKFRDIALFWMDKGVDGFRYDMAEMVPVEFWSYLNSAIKMKNPDAFLLAEIYNPAEYRNYIRLGKMDYLYDKVQLYDTLKNIILGKGLPRHITDIQENLKDIESHMLHFLENHDEQRIASPAFAGNAERGKPMMVVSATIGTSPAMIYFGQEVGEPGAIEAGFGKSSRTTIFDYAGVPSHQRWMNGGRFDGALLLPDELKLRNFYRKLLNFSISSEALKGKFQPLGNESQNPGEKCQMIYSFARWDEKERLVITVNFDKVKKSSFKITIPADVMAQWDIKDGDYQLTDQLYSVKTADLKVENGTGTLAVELDPNESLILK